MPNGQITAGNFDFCFRVKDSHNKINAEFSFLIAEKGLDFVHLHNPPVSRPATADIWREEQFRTGREMRISDQFLPVRYVPILGGNF